MTEGKAMPGQRSEPLSTAAMAHREFLLRNIQVVYDILDALYESPNHGNKSNPMDELIYIHLSKRTREEGYKKAYAKLSKTFPEWRGLAGANPGRVARVIRSAGLGRTRAEELVHNAKVIKKMFGRETLGPLREWSDTRIFNFLTGLRGIGPKSARCIMMYSLGRMEFPVDTHVQRVCERLGFVDPDINHRVAQESLRGLFPKKYRYGLHVNMVAHGRALCLSGTKPKCEGCELRKFCLHYRNRQSSAPQDAPVMVDLFSGCGGASYGFEKAGFRVTFAADIDRSSTDTYYLNVPGVSFDQVKTLDLRGPDGGAIRETVGAEVDVVFGGPPCQGWSNIGKTRKNSFNGNSFFKDERNVLFFNFLDYVDKLSPHFVVMENVTGLMTAHDGKYLTAIEEEFLKHGYRSVRFVLNAADYAVPQNRSRLFFIGRKIHSEVTDSTDSELSAILERIKSRADTHRVSFRNSMKGLPHLRPGTGANVLRKDGQPLQWTKCSRLGKQAGLVFNHFARKHNPRDLKIYRRLGEGEDYLSFSKRVKKSDLKPYSTESFHTKFRKIRGNEPCFTVIAHLHKDSNSYIHPDDNRGITVREAARVQSFPDDFIFLAEGFSQFILVGNALPPKLAEVIGSAISEFIPVRGVTRCRTNQRD